MMRQMPDKPPPDAAVLGVFFRIEMAADLAAIMPKRTFPELSRRSPRFSCGWRTKCAVLATRSALHAQIMSERIQDAWVALSRRRGVKVAGTGISDNPG